MGTAAQTPPQSDAALKEQAGRASK